MFFFPGAAGAGQSTFVTFVPNSWVQNLNNPRVPRLIWPGNSIFSGRSGSNRGIERQCPRGRLTKHHSCLIGKRAVRYSHVCIFSVPKTTYQATHIHEDSFSTNGRPWLERKIPTIMAPLTPHWTQPSHPEIQQVIIGKEGEFSSKSVSKIAVAPLGRYAELTTPPCTFVDASTYATVQAGRDRHILLNSDLLYLNHSCEPSLVSAKTIKRTSPGST